MILGVLCEQTMLLESVTDIVQPITVNGNLNVDIKGIAYDSRRVKPGTLFVAVKGEHYDGNQFVDEAIERGAVAVVSERKELIRKDAVHIHVHSARQALAELACAFYGNPSRKLELVGITGTNGKTTTAYMVRAIFEEDGRNPGLISTVSYDIGKRSIPASRTTPESLDLQAMLNEMVREGCRSAVMEVSSHALVQKRVWGVDFDVGVFTNLTQDHLDYHDSMEQYFAAKALLFRGLGQMEKDAVAVINLDNEWGLRLANTGGSWAREITFGEHPSAMVRARDVVMDDYGCRFTVDSPWGEADLELPTLGRFSVSNALAALSVCCERGVGLDVVKRAFARFRPVPGRLEEIPNDRNLRVFVDYAHTPEALQCVLETLRNVAHGRIVTVFGCGGNRDKEKRALMGVVVSKYSDYSVITSDNPRKEDPLQIIDQIKAGYGDESEYEIREDRETAIECALRIAEEGDIVLIAGKGHENYQEFADTIVPFDDREIARNSLQ